jgi:hypothetical protein
LKEKQEKAEKRAGASLATWVRLGALNEARNLTSTNSDTSKTAWKITTKNREESNDKRRHKNLTLCIAYHSVLVSPAPFGSALVTITPFLEGVNTGRCNLHHYRDRERQKTGKKVYITLYLHLSHTNGEP